MTPAQRKAARCLACRSTGNEPGGGNAVPCGRCNGHGWIAINFPQPNAYSPAGDKPEIVDPASLTQLAMTPITITPEALEDALVDALAWARAYGSAISENQWDDDATSR